MVLAALQEAVGAEEGEGEEGEFGEIYMARGLCFKSRQTTLKTPVERCGARPVLRHVDGGRIADASVTKRRSIRNWLLVFWTRATEISAIKEVS